MEKSQAYIIAAAIVVAGLIVAAAVLGVEKPGRYVAIDNAGVRIFDTQSGQVWLGGMSEDSEAIVRRVMITNRD